MPTNKQWDNALLDEFLYGGDEDRRKVPAAWEELSALRASVDHQKINEFYDDDGHLYIWASVTSANSLIHSAGGINAGSVDEMKIIELALEAAPGLSCALQDMYRQAFMDGFAAALSGMLTDANLPQWRQELAGLVNP